MAIQVDETIYQQLLAVEGLIKEREMVWTKEEQELEAQLVDYIAAMAWDNQKELPSLLAQIRDITDGAMVRPASADTVTEWREKIPSHYRRMARGIPADLVADALGMEGGESELLAAIQDEVLAGRYHARAEAQAQAEREALQHPDYLALVAAHEQERAEWGAMRTDLLQQLAASAEVETTASAPRVLPAPMPRRVDRVRRQRARTRNSWDGLADLLAVVMAWIRFLEGQLRAGTAQARATGHHIWYTVAMRRAVLESRIRAEVFLVRYRWAQGLRIQFEIRIGGKSDA